MEAEVDFVSGSANLVHNVLEITEDVIIYATHHALLLYHLPTEKVVGTFVEHDGRVNSVRLLRNSGEYWLVSGGSEGGVVLWRNLSGCGDGLELGAKQKTEGAVLVVDGIIDGLDEVLIGCVTSLSKVIIFHVSLKSGADLDMRLVQEVDLRESLALDLVFHRLPCEQQILFGLAMDSGEVGLYGREAQTHHFSHMASLKKHDDWVRCLAFTDLPNGDTLVASGGEDSLIAVWRFLGGTGSEGTDFEFQIQHFHNTRILFDSLIMGHEGWVNSLQWNDQEELLSCSSDHSLIIWQNSGDIWTEKARLGTVGGQIPGGFGARFNRTTLVTWGFQGAIQIWILQDEEWVIRPSVTGHFEPISDLDFHPDGHFFVSTGLDQTTRVFAPWGPGRWHEVGRPQIHGHDLFAVRCSGDLIVSGAEEKILRVFQPTRVLLDILEETTGRTISLSNVGEGASLPALGLSNQTGAEAVGAAGQPLSARLDEDFLRTHTLWPEVAKLYGHVYEIASIAASPTGSLVASSCESSKAQFASILLWDTSTWKLLGQYTHHKLSVTQLQFSFDGRSLLSVSRDRTWALWEICQSPDGVEMGVIETGSFHTRALWVGVWSPDATFFVTGGRDKRLALWKTKQTELRRGFERECTEMFEGVVTAAAVNENHVIGVGLESGLILLLTFDPRLSTQFRLLLRMDRNMAHHGAVKRLLFNPMDKFQLVSAGADRLLKVYTLRPTSMGKESLDS